MQQRSTFVTVVGWIFIVLSGFMLLYCLMMMFIPFDKIMGAAQLPAQQPGTPPVDAGMMASMMRGVFIFMFCVTAWVLLSSIGLVMRKGWARISFIVILSIDIFFSAIYVLIGLAGRSMQGTLPPGTDPAMAAMTHIMMTIMAVMGGVFVVLFSWIIYMLCRQKIIQEFTPQAQQPKP